MRIVNQPLIVSAALIYRVGAMSRAANRNLKLPVTIKLQEERNSLELMRIKSLSTILRRIIQIAPGRSHI